MARMMRWMVAALLAVLLSPPTIASTLGGGGQITGKFTAEEVNGLVRALTAGSLPARLMPEPVAEFPHTPAPASGPAGR